MFTTCAPFSHATSTPRSRSESRHSSLVPVPAGVQTGIDDDVGAGRDALDAEGVVLDRAHDAGDHRAVRGGLRRRAAVERHDARPEQIAVIGIGRGVEHGDARALAVGDAARGVDLRDVESVLEIAVRIGAGGRSGRTSVGGRHVDVVAHHARIPPARG